MKNKSEEISFTQLKQRTLMTADGRILVLPEAGKEIEINKQLFRYAEDLQQLIEQNERLNSHYKELLISSNHLLASHDELNNLLSISNDIHIVTDLEGKVLQTNPSVKLIALPERIIGTNLKDWIIPSHIEQFNSMMNCEINDQEQIVKETELHLKSEQTSEKMLIVTAKLFPVNVDGGVNNLHWIIRDITFLKETEFAAKLTSSLLSMSKEGIMVTDIDGIIIGINKSFYDITGYHEEEVIGKTPSFLQSGYQDKSFYQEMWGELKKHGSWQGKVYNKKKNGTIYPELLKITQARDSKGRVLSYIGVFSDLSQLQKAEDDLAFIAHHDSLTGLANRLLLKDRLDQAIANGRRNNFLFTLIFIDLDRFKQVNDQLGHDVGDHVLQQVAKRVEYSLREVDTIARIGGDEFVVIVPGLTGDINIERISKKIIDELIKPMQIEKHEISIGASLGCAEFPRDGEDVAQLMRNADAAMYRAKSSGGNKYCIANQESSK